MLVSARFSPEYFGAFLFSSDTLQRKHLHPNRQTPVIVLSAPYLSVPSVLHHFAHVAVLLGSLHRSPPLPGFLFGQPPLKHGVQLPEENRAGDSAAVPLVESLEQGLKIVEVRCQG